MSKPSHKKKAVSETVSAAKSSFAPSSMLLLRLLAIVQLFYIGVAFQPQLTTNGDDAKYLVLSQALVAGEGFRDIAYVDQPVETQYPLVFPAFLSLFSAFTNKPLLALSAVSFMAVVVLLLSHLLFRRKLPFSPFYVIVPLAFSWLLAEFSTTLMSEVPYVILTLLAMYFFERSREEPDNRKLFWTATIVSVLPAHCRSIGIAFSAAWIVMYLARRHYRGAFAHVAILAVSIALVKSFTAWGNPYMLQLFERDSYNPEAGFVSSFEMRIRILGNIGAYLFVIIPKTFFSLPVNIPAWAAKTTGIICSGLLVIGWAKNLRSGLRIASVYVVFYGAILLMWQQQWSSERFLAGIIAFLYLFLILGIHTVLSFAASRLKSNRSRNENERTSALAQPWRSLLNGSVVLLLVVNCWFYLGTVEKRRRLGPDWSNFYSCADWIRLNTSPDAVVVSRKPSLFYLRARRAGFVYPFSHDVEKVIESLRTGGATHVIFDNFSWTATTARYLYPALTSRPELFRVVYALKNPDTFVLEFVKQ